MKNRQTVFVFSSIAIAILLTVVAVWAAPRSAEAVFGEANPACIPAGKPPKGKDGLPCKDVTNGGTTNGVCTGGMCLGKTSAGLDGLQQALGMAKQIMDLLKGGGEKPKTGDNAPPSQIPGGCLTGYYNTTATTSPDPCALYTPALISGELNGDSNNISNSLLDALGGESGDDTNTSGSTGSTNVSNQLTNQLSGTAQNTNTSNQAQQGTAQFSDTSTSGLSGNINVGNAGATIVANLRQGLTEVAGFFGGGTTIGSSSTSVAGRMCSSRPWAKSGFIASLAPDSFFDGICSRAGYQVGVVQQVNTGGTAITTKKTTTTTKAPTTTQVQTNIVQPQTDIWAEPTSVRLGVRTFIFWNSKGVNACTVTGPSFTQSALSGGASTVPITGASTFNIECTAPDGTKVTDSVTVNLAI